ncbi:hypothetical protein ABZP36_004098 [Zizania latifolia]
MHARCTLACPAPAGLLGGCRGKCVHVPAALFCSCHRMASAFGSGARAQGDSRMWGSGSQFPHTPVSASAFSSATRRGRDQLVAPSLKFCAARPPMPPCVRARGGPSLSRAGASGLGKCGMRRAAPLTTSGRPCGVRPVPRPARDVANTH